MPSKKKRIIYEDLKTLLDRLPPEMEPELREHIEGLLKRERAGPKRRLRLDWAGGLRKFRGRYTSVSLQKESLAWWTQ